MMMKCENDKSKRRLEWWLRLIWFWHIFAKAWRMPHGIKTTAGSSFCDVQVDANETELGGYWKWCHFNFEIFDINFLQLLKNFLKFVWKITFNILIPTFVQTPINSAKFPYNLDIFTQQAQFLRLYPRKTSNSALKSFHSATANRILIITMRKNKFSYRMPKRRRKKCVAVY
jgi:hypothetical protein